MSVLTRRKLLQGVAAVGAAGIGLSAAGKFAGWAAAKPEPLILKTASIEARLTDGAPTKNVLTYGEAGPVGRQDAEG